MGLGFLGSPNPPSISIISSYSPFSNTRHSHIIIQNICKDEKHYIVTAIALQFRIGSNLHGFI